ncbi:hypothetical protein GPECTOR_37g239 [Gonium pectorale]|uniref:Proteasome adapter and scaffold protein ECM29 HEAT-repeat domain-containing protein n=1 Tax=Gonium pectorale TaxID=33097 RepID=A0A150GBT7_GONPE|nr:hypothetical protein GPECTOR_37g239 [Gonium pectorale]|eukprot:KXZ47233.1 hypothetical protein GPECTOR_37g239 [Gonium pectorale]
MPAGWAGHFGAILTDLLREMGGRLWRNRQAACSAAADLMQGRRWPELAPHMAQLWTMTFRAMDDIKESVRRAALSLARSLRGLTLRLADPQHTGAAGWGGAGGLVYCASAVATVFPVLLEQGLPSSVPEAAPPHALRPLLAALVPPLLEALSSLEDVRLNYVEQHAERLGLDSERLEGARVAAARASPLGDTLDLAARLADGPSLESLVPALVATVKRGVGLNTKVGTARFIRQLASRPATATAAPAPAASSAAAAAPDAAAAAAAAAPVPLLRPHAAPLLRALVGAVAGERSGTVRRAYAGAAAQVVRHAGEKRMDKFVADALASYAEPGADADARLCGGLLLRELLRAAPERMRAYDTAVLPAAFGARMDEDKEVAGVWGEIWEEGVSSEPAALRLYGSEICRTLVEMLGGTQWGRKKAAAEAAVRLTEVAPDALGAHARRLASALLSELAGGRLWDGKESLLAALAALAAADPRVIAEEPGHGAVVEALMGAVGRKKTSYRAAGLSALEKALRALPGDHYARVAPPLLASVQQLRLAALAALGAIVAAVGPTAAAAVGAPGQAEAPGGAGWSEEDRRVVLPEVVSGLAALAEADKSAAVVAAAGEIRSALQPLLLLPAGAASTPGDAMDVA